MEITLQAVAHQISGMGNDVFEIGLYRPQTENDARHTPEMLLRTWNREALMNSLHWMRLQNLHARNIYIRPAGEHNLSLVDDLSAESVERMKRTGFDPAVIVETSPRNFQAWLKHEKPMSPELGTAVARALAQDFEGDKGAADWRHFGRLSGFTNRKEKHRMDNGQYPFVRLIEAWSLPNRGQQ